MLLCGLHRPFWRTHSLDNVYHTREGPGLACGAWAQTTRQCHAVTNGRGLGTAREPHVPQGRGMSRKRHCPEVFWVLGGHQRGSTSAWRSPGVMPADRKSTRGRIRSRTRAKFRGLQREQSKKVNLGGESSAENPATESNPRGSMASAQQSRGQASVHGVRGETRRSTVKVWVSQRFGLFLLGFWFLLLLCFYTSAGECLPGGHWAGVPQGNWRVRVRGRCQRGRPLWCEGHLWLPHSRPSY